jgi:hypothetical protein
MEPNMLRYRMPVRRLVVMGLAATSILASSLYIRVELVVVPRGHAWSPTRRDLLGDAALRPLWYTVALGILCATGLGYLLGRGLLLRRRGFVRLGDEGVCARGAAGKEIALSWERVEEVEATVMPARLWPTFPWLTIRGGGLAIRIDDWLERRHDVQDALIAHASLGAPVKHRAHLVYRRQSPGSDEESPGGAPRSY